MKKFTLLFLVVLLSSSAAGARASELPRLVINSGGHMGFIRDIAFTQDGRFLISAGDDKVIRIWDSETGNTVRTIRGQIGDGDEGKINALALSKDDKYLAVGGYFPGSPEERGAIRVYDFNSGELIALLKGHKGAVLSLAFSPDGSRLISGGDFQDKTARIWNVEDPQRTTQLHHLAEHRDGVFSVAFSVDGARAVTASRDTTLRLWDANQGKHLKIINATGPTRSEQVDALKFSPDGRYLASASRAGRVVLWNAGTGDFIRQLGRGAGVVTSLSFSPDSERLLTGSETRLCSIFNLSSPTPIRFVHETLVDATAFSPDGKTVATAGGGTIGIFLRNARTGSVSKILTGDGQAMEAVGFARDGRSIAFRGMRNTDRGSALKQSIILKQGGVHKVEFGTAVNNQAQYFGEVQSAGGYTLRSTRVVITTRERVLYRWQLHVLRRGQTKLIGSDHSDYRRVIETLTHDGRYAFSGAERGYLTRYKTEPAPGDRPLDLVGHTNRILSLAVSPDSKTLLSGSNDQTLKLWDIETGRNLLTIFVGDDEEWVAWTPEGYYASSLNGDKYIGWHINQGANKAAKFYSAAQFQKDFYRPDVVAEYLSTRDIQVAVQRANERRKEAGFRGDALGATDITALLPPSVEVISPKERESTVGDPILNVRAVIRSARLPITMIKVFLNGAPQGTFDGNSHNSELDLQVRLEPGSNTLTVIAFNEQSYSEPEKRKINYLPSRAGNHSHKEPSRIDFAPSIKLRFGPESRIEYLGVAHAPTRRGSAIAEPAPLERKTSVRQGATPPQVVVISPDAAETEQEDQTLTIKATGISFTSPITQIKVSVNGKVNTAKFDSDSKRQEAEMQVTLQPGLNVLSITASDKASTSEPQTRRVTCNASTQTGKPDLIFLGIGISKYQNSVAGTAFQDLSFADRDVTEVAKVFEKQNSLQPMASRVFDSVKSKIIPNNEATKEAILKGLKWMSDEAKKNSNNIHVLYLAGHGGMDDTENYYFYSHHHVPDIHPDNNNVQWGVIMSSLINAPGKSVIFIDTCHAGGTKGDTDLQAVRNKYREDFTGVFTFMASDANGVSIEKPELQHGVFTKAVLDGLSGAADLPPKDGKIDVDELGRYVKTQVSELAKGQQRAGYLNYTGFDTLILFSNPN